MLKQKEMNQSFEITKLFLPFLTWVLLSSVTGIGAGAATVALLDTINHALHPPEGLTKNLLLMFIALCILVLIGRVISDISTNLVGQRLIALIRKALARKILEAPIDVLERYRTHRVSSASGDRAQSIDKRRRIQYHRSVNGSA
jgi:putative ATP-binding cassette transporter